MLLIWERAKEFFKKIDKNAYSVMGCPAFLRLSDESAVIGTQMTVFTAHTFFLGVTTVWGDGRN